MVNNNVKVNLFDKSTAQIEKYVDWGNGKLNYNSSYLSSDFIKIEPLAQYDSNVVNRSLAFYDSEKKFILGQQFPSNIITPPENASYLRITAPKSDIDLFELKLASGEDFIFLPQEIVVAVGRTIELYNKQVICVGNIDNYHFKWECEFGKAMGRKFSITASAEFIGEYPLSLTIFDNDMEEISKASTIIKLVEDKVPSQKTILTIGDSLSNSKSWLEEVRLLSGGKYEMVGTRGTAPLKHEARSGWSAETYLSGESYDYENEGINPFWDGQRFNWDYYKESTKIKPDAIQIYLGTNEIDLNPNNNASNIKQIVDYIRQDDDCIPIFVVFTIYRGPQDGIANEIEAQNYEIGLGSYKLEEDKKVFNLMMRLKSLLSSYSNLHFVPLSLCHDSEFNFGAIETPVNPRAIQTEFLAREASHPQEQGYLQMADIIFSVFAKYLK